MILGVTTSGSFACNEDAISEKVLPAMNYNLIQNELIVDLFKIKF